MSSQPQQQDGATIEVAGLRVHLCGLSCLANTTCPDLVFVLHGRTQQASDVDPIVSAIHASNDDTIVASFDARNHGHRLLSIEKNGGWTDGNVSHAQDMFSILYGTARDVSDLISLLPMFLSKSADLRFRRIFCVGVSLGGHSTYIALSDDPRIDAGVVIIGCPDLAGLLTSRAGDDAAEKVPPSLVETLQRFGTKANRLAEKDVLILKGDEDPLVPWTASETFVKKLPREKATVIGYHGVEHAVTKEMVDDTAVWIRKVRETV